MWPRCAEATAPARPASSGGSRRNEPASWPAQLLEGCHTPRPVGPCHHGAALRPPLPPPHSLTRAPRLAPFPGTAVGPSEQSRTVSPRQDPRPGHSCGVPSGTLIQHDAWRTPAHGVRSLLRPWSVPRSSMRLDRCRPRGPGELHTAGDIREWQGRKAGVRGPTGTAAGTSERLPAHEPPAHSRGDGQRSGP